MTLFILFICVFQTALFKNISTKSLIDDFDVIFFENVNFKGIFVFIIIYWLFLIIIYNLIGKYHEAHLKTNDCVNLPKKWQNRASSLSTNKCIVIFTTQNCKYNKETQLYTKLTEKYFDVNFSYPNNIPSFNFYGSRYTIRIIDL